MGDHWTPEREQRARELADRLVYDHDDAPGLLGPCLLGGGSNRSEAIDAIIYALRQWDAETAEPLRAEVAALQGELAEMQRVVVEADLRINELEEDWNYRQDDSAGKWQQAKEAGKQELRPEIDRLRAEVARLQSELRIEARYRNEIAGTDLTALRAVRDAAAEILRIADPDAAVSRLKQALATCPAPSGKEGT